jgi:uncharacterized protein Yka (UPF0111/DUF47 family)
MFDIEEFWIINGNGAIEYWYSPSKKLDPNIEYPFLTKICHRIQELNKSSDLIRKEELNMLENDGYFYYYLGSPTINSILIAKSSKKFEPFKLYLDLCEVEKLFRHYFAEAIEKMEQSQNGILDIEELKDTFDHQFFREYFKNHLE